MFACVGVRSVHAQTEAVHAQVGEQKERQRDRERGRAFIRSVLHNGGSRTITLARDHTCADVAVSTNNNLPAATLGFHADHGAGERVWGANLGKTSQTSAT